MMCEYSLQNEKYPALHCGQPALGCLHDLKRKGIEGWTGWEEEEGRLRFLLGPPPGVKYCSDMLLCGLLGNRGGGGLGFQGGWWVIGRHDGLITHPLSFFHSD